MSQPLVSIIIPAKDAQNTLKKCLDSVLGLGYGNIEVIVIDDGSQDNTPLILKEYADKISVIANPCAIGPSACRNAASKIARGEYLAFTDSDCLADKCWIEELLRGFSGQDVAAVGGSQGMPQDESDFGRLISRFMYKIGFILDYIHADKGRMLKVSHNPSCNALYSKDVFLKEGGFLEGLWPGEDVELDYRLSRKGYRLIFNPRAIVYHYRPDRLKKFCRMMFRYGLAQGFLVRRYGIFRKIQLLPFLSVFCVVLLFFIGQANLPILSVLLLSAFALAAFYLSDLYFLLLGTVTLFYWHMGFVKGLFKKIA